jgi:cobalt-zinc-cadmium efflux system outer membrane protein
MPEWCRILSSLLAAGLAVSGCVSYTPAPLDVASTVRSYNARNLENQDLVRYIDTHDARPTTAQPARWDFDRLTLAAFYYSPELDAARAKSATASAAVQSASQLPNPTLQIPFEYTSNPKYGESPYTLGLGLDIPIETAGKRGYRVALARQLSVAAQFDVGATAWQVRSRLRSALAELFFARHRSQVLAQRIDVREHAVHLLDKRRSLGAASTPEVLQALSLLAQDRLELSAAQQRVGDAQGAAAATIGVPLAEFRSLELSLEGFEAPLLSIPNGIAVDLALQNRADVLDALAAYEASQAGLQLEVANQYPDIHLGPGYTFDAGAHKFALSLSGLSLPLFNQNQGQIAEAQAKRREAGAHFIVVQTQAIAQAEQALQRYGAAVSAVNLANSLVETNLKQLNAARRSLAAGETDQLDLTLTRANELSSILALEDARGQLQHAVGEVEDALQRPLWAADIPKR